MTPLDTRDAAREALKPTGAASAVIREVTPEIPPAVQVEIDPHAQLEAIKTGLRMALQDLEFVKAADPFAAHFKANCIAELRGTLRNVESLRPVTR